MTLPLRPRFPKCRPVLEALEPREVPTVTAVNDVFTVPVNSPAVILPVTLNDTSSTSSPIAVVSNTSATAGTGTASITTRADGVTKDLRFQPAAGYVGSSTFSVTLTDNGGTTTATSTVTVNVAQVFPNGVAAGEVTQNSAVLWVHSLTAGTVTFEVSTDPALTAPAGAPTASGPYVTPIADGVTTTALITAKDTVPLTGGTAGQTYTFDGTPDGIGIFDNGDGTATLLVNHEFGAAQGVVRAHGATGSYVSRFVINKATLQIISGKDQDQQVLIWDPTANGGAGGYVNATKAFERFCSGDLAAPSAFFNPATGLGTQERIYLNGEETRPPFTTGYGSAWAHVATGADNGKAFELPWFGKMSYENQLANPFAQDKTLVMLQDDSTNSFTTSVNPTNPPSELYIYVGVKKATGLDVDKAGLTGGSLFGIKVGSATNEDGFTSGAAFTLQNMGNVVTDTDGKTLQNTSITTGVTQFRRIEDGAWDPLRPTDYYFVTTDQVAGRSKLFRLRYTDLTNPQLGGTIDVLLDGIEGQQMFDNLTIDTKGHVFIQEDIGNNARLGKIWQYDIATDTLTVLGQHNPTLFQNGSPTFVTQDEESSGIVDASAIFGPGKLIFGVQAHNAIASPASVVEGGQLLVMDVSGLGRLASQTRTAIVTDPTVPVKVSVDQLLPNTTYYYKIVDSGAAVGYGTFTTPAASGFNGLTFGVSGDQRGELAPYPALANADTAGLDFFAHLGDSIYADFASPDLTATQATSLSDFRIKNNEVYTSHSGLNTLADLRGSTPFVVTTDDHEVTDNFAGGAAPSSDPRFDNTGAFINETNLFKNGYQAFTEYNPIANQTYGATGDPLTANKPKLYRYQTYGQDAATFVLDNRTFRSPEIAPVTNLADTADVTRFLTQANDPSRTFLGAAQFADLKRDLLAAQAAGVTWKFIFTPEPIANYGVLNAEDRWEGYAAERTALLKFIDDNGIKNVVFVTADFHGSLVNRLSYQLTPGGPQVQTNSIEVVTGAVAFDKPFGPSVVDIAQFAGLLTPAQAAFYASLPPAQQEGFIANLLNSTISSLGYNPFSPTANPAPNVTLVSGSYLNTSQYSWTQFSVDPATQQLRVQTWGIPSYSEQDLINNPGAVAARTPVLLGEFTVDDLAGPLVSISPPSATSARNGDSVSYTVTFTDGNLANVDLTADDVVLNKTGSAGATVTVTGTGSTRTVTLSNFKGAGTLGISLPAGTAVDTLGNEALAAGPSATFDVKADGVAGKTAFATGGSDGGEDGVRVYSADGTELFTADPFPGFSGGVRVVTADVTGDGVLDLIAGAGPGGTPTVVLIDGATKREITRFPAFEGAFTGGVYVAAGDFDRDGKAEVVVTADQGGGPVVAVYRGAELAAGNAVELVRFLGIQDDSFRGGARAAVGDVTGDGIPEIVVSAGFLGGPRIQVWDGTTIAAGVKPTTALANFFAFEDTLRNGAFVAIGDVNGDGIGDLIFGGGPNGGPRVRIADGADTLFLGDALGTLDDPQFSGLTIGNFVSGNSDSRGGIRVAVADLDGDDLADVLTGGGDGQSATVMGYRGVGITATDPAPLFDLDAFDQDNGVFVG